MKLLLILLMLVLFFHGCATPKVDSTAPLASYLDNKVLQRIDFQGRDTVLHQMNGLWYYVRQDGKFIHVITDEEGSVDHFKEGLARTRVNGKVGYFNQSLDIVLVPKYDYAFPFHNGVAEICMGCKELQDNGNSVLDGGTWKRIDRRGLIVEE